MEQFGKNFYLLKETYQNLMIKNIILTGELNKGKENQHFTISHKTRNKKTILLIFKVIC